MATWNVSIYDLFNGTICYFSLIFTLYQIFYVNKINTNEMRGHVAHMGDRRGVHNVLVGKGRRHLDNLSVDERVTLYWILKIG
jgi:hypothetical protein